MANYKSMYHKLFLEVNDTIDRLKSTLLEVENMYINHEDVVLTIAESSDKQNTEDDDSR